MQVALPERDGVEVLIQPSRECELVFNREMFLRFASQIADLRTWLEAHPITAGGTDETNVNNMTNDELLAYWARRG
jgi:hypothetical protein